MGVGWLVGWGTIVVEWAGVGGLVCVCVCVCGGCKVPGWLLE